MELLDTNLQTQALWLRVCVLTHSIAFGTFGKPPSLFSLPLDYPVSTSPLPLGSSVLHIPVRGRGGDRGSGRDKG